MILDWAGLESLLCNAGHSLYGGEAISQLEHALQSAECAERDGASAALTTAALLHDLGHLVSGQADDDLANGIDDRHEQIGIAALRGLFGDDVLAPIALHVAAKRYLCAVEPTYLAELSPASCLSLALQGGVMTTAEAERFDRNPHAAAAIALRRWDDEAKVVGKTTPTLGHYLAIARGAARTTAGALQ
ncbi:phosphonate degradation HD-domain oxygenase [Jeongeupia naejangsanensis]|uniref:HD domain-containing protein n=1 Tax=Jeongeupia naejangsanensis TaxID=613195 RepID=A0ABS2BJZ0_9NEIS|nr:phosphonate degradation HD-domain oxygenase [Jeongeupia naejangsanensis]MBM3115403.1 HD domain-containing protein [Jeongeupia naejangsanensis]